MVCELYVGLKREDTEESYPDNEASWQLPFTYEPLFSWNVCGRPAVQQPRYHLEDKGGLRAGSQDPVKFFLAEAVCHIFC